MNVIIEAEDDLGEDIMQQLNTLYQTIEGTCPMDREFGLTIEGLDKPPQIAKNIYAIDIVEKTEKYVPQVEVSEVTFEVENERLCPHVKIKTNEDYEEGEDEEW